MLTTLKGAALWVAGGLVLAIVGAATYLASQGILSGSDWLVIGTAVLASVGIVTTAHVTGQQVASALVTPPPAGASPPVPPGATGGGEPLKEQVI
jgi:hypothetical protein